MCIVSSDIIPAKLYDIKLMLLILILLVFFEICLHICLGFIVLWALEA